MGSTPSWQRQRLDVNGVVYSSPALRRVRTTLVEVDQPTSLPDGRVLEDGDDYLGTVNDDPRGDFDPDRVDAFTAIQPLRRRTGSRITTSLSG